MALGASFSEINDGINYEDEGEISPFWQIPLGYSLDCTVEGQQERNLRHRLSTRSMHSRTRTLERVITSVFVPGNSPGYEGTGHSITQNNKKNYSLSIFSSHATVGRNSQFHNLSVEDRERLGGIEYRSLKLLLKIVTGYFFGLHMFGAISLVGWILHADPKYRDYLAECGQGSVWW